MENQKSNIVIKLTREEVYKIEYAAKARGMNCNDYIVDSALHRECRLTPAILCKMENILQRCLQSVDNPKLQKWFRKEMAELWGYLR